MNKSILSDVDARRIEAAETRLLRNNDLLPPVLDPLQTAKFLSDSELKPLREAFASNEATLSTLTVNICDIKAILKRLHTLENDAGTDVKYRQAVFSPIRQLPPELLVYIFEMTRVPAVKLASVCKYWRDVAFSTPSLWSNLQMAQYSTERSEKMLNIFLLSLKYSRDYPLNVRIELNSGMPQVMVDTALSSSSRWGSAFIHFAEDWSNRWSSFKSDFDGIRGKVPLLRTLLLSGIPCWEELTAFEVAPQLNQLHLRYLEIYGSPVEEITWPLSPLQNMRLPWSQLTSVTLYTELPTPNYVNLLQQVINLEFLDIRRLTLNNTVVNTMASLTKGPVTLSRMQVLHFNGHTDIQAFHFLTLPNLSSIQICLGHNDYEDPAGVVAGLESAIQRSACKVAKLIICGQPHDDVSIRIMNAVSEITTLHISPNNWREEILIEVLKNMKATPQQFLIKLKTLCFDYLYPSCFKEIVDLLAYMVNRQEHDFAQGAAKECHSRFGLMGMYGGEELDDGFSYVAQVKTWRDEGHLDLDLNWLNRPHSDDLT